MTLSLNSTDLESFKELVENNQADFVEALQHISDTDSESALDATHFGLYLASDDEDRDAHFGNCLNTYFTLIGIAEEDYEGDLSKPVAIFLEQDTDEDQSENILHLEKCLTIQPEESIK